MTIATTVPYRHVGNWTNPCGGTLWRELPDASIEVQGAGVPLYAPGTARFGYLEATYANWRKLFHRSASEYELPVSWLLAIATVETGLWSDDRREQETILSPVGATGIMQIMPATAKLLDYDPADMSDAATNIDAGANLLRRLSDRIRSGLPAISGAYNSGRVCCDDPNGCAPGCANQYRVCTTGDYPGDAIRYNNAAIAHLDMSASTPLKYAGAGLLGAAIAGAYIYAQQRS